MDKYIYYTWLFVLIIVLAYFNNMIYYILKKYDYEQWRKIRIKLLWVKGYYGKVIKYNSNHENKEIRFWVNCYDRVCRWLLYILFILLISQLLIALISSIS